MTNLMHMSGWRRTYVMVRGTVLAIGGAALVLFAVSLLF
jgi:hypothetical protein